GAKVSRVAHAPVIWVRHPVLQRFRSYGAGIEFYQYAAPAGAGTRRRDRGSAIMQGGKAGLTPERPGNRISQERDF
ncbi:MAG: hypothetical protein LC113_08745, partial [Acidobacteria bacterium]|nr:hypothetical protein [Acidobacteriota bacterium]